MKDISPIIIIIEIWGKMFPFLSVIEILIFGSWVQKTQPPTQSNITYEQLTAIIIIIIVEIKGVINPR